MAMQYGSQVLLAIITLLIGWWVIGRIANGILAVMEKRNIDKSLHGFVGNLIAIGLKILLIISVAGMIGVETTSFIAVIGAAGLAVGFALQGSLANGNITNYSRQPTRRVDVNIRIDYGDDIKKARKSCCAWPMRMSVC